MNPPFVPETVPFNPLFTGSDCLRRTALEIRTKDRGSRRGKRWRFRGTQGNLQRSCGRSRRSTRRRPDRLACKPACVTSAPALRSIQLAHSPRHACALIVASATSLPITTRACSPRSEARPLAAESTVHVVFQKTNTTPRLRNPSIPRRSRDAADRKPLPAGRRRAPGAARGRRRTRNDRAVHVSGSLGLSRRAATDLRRLGQHVAKHGRRGSAGVRLADGSFGR